MCIFNKIKWNFQRTRSSSPTLVWWSWVFYIPFHTRAFYIHDSNRSVFLIYTLPWSFNILAWAPSRVDECFLWPSWKCQFPVCWFFRLTFLSFCTLPLSVTCLMLFYGSYLSSDRSSGKQLLLPPLLWNLLTNAVRSHHLLLAGLKARHTLAPWWIQDGHLRGTECLPSHLPPHCIAPTNKQTKSIPCW